MRILPANIPAPASKTTPSTVSPAVDQARRYPSEARDSYTPNSGPQVIDAEYVEFYTPSVNQFNKERQNLDDTLEPGTETFADGTDGSSTAATPAMNRYQLQAHNAPPPGTFIDTFA